MVLVDHISLGTVLNLRRTLLLYCITSGHGWALFGSSWQFQKSFVPRILTVMVGINDHMGLGTVPSLKRV